MNECNKYLHIFVKTVYEKEEEKCFSRKLIFLKVFRTLVYFWCFAVNFSNKENVFLSSSRIYVFQFANQKSTQKIYIFIWELFTLEEWKSYNEANNKNNFNLLVELWITQDKISVLWSFHLHFSLWGIFEEPFWIECKAQ